MLSRVLFKTISRHNIKRSFSDAINKSNMYVPSHFKSNNEEFFHSIISTYPFATVIITQDNIPNIVHMPLLYDIENKCLKGHIAKANHINKIDFNIPYHCLAIFQGPDAYISPSWYQTKVDTGKVVPTWNYITIHIEGKINLINDKNWILQNVSLLSDKHEQSIGSKWRVNDAPKSYIDTLIRAVTGIEISIVSSKAQFKLSQNKNISDFNGVLNGLKSTGKEGDKQVAEWMEKVHKPSV